MGRSPSPLFILIPLDSSDLHSPSGNPETSWERSSSCPNSEEAHIRLHRRSNPLSLSYPREPSSRRKPSPERFPGEAWGSGNPSPNHRYPTPKIGRFPGHSGYNVLNTQRRLGGPPQEVGLELGDIAKAAFLERTELLQHRKPLLQPRDVECNGNGTILLGRKFHHDGFLAQQPLSEAGRIVEGKDTVAVRAKHVACLNRRVIINPVTQALASRRLVTSRKGYERLKVVFAPV